MYLIMFVSAATAPFRAGLFQPTFDRFGGVGKAWFFARM
jgi:hypothetical protein